MLLGSRNTDDPEILKTFVKEHLRKLPPKLLSGTPGVTIELIGLNQAFVDDHGNSAKKYSASDIFRKLKSRSAFHMKKSSSG